MLLSLVTPHLAVAVQPCMEWIPFLLKKSDQQKDKDFWINFTADKNAMKIIKKIQFRISQANLFPWNVYRLGNRGDNVNHLIVSYQC